MISNLNLLVKRKTHNISKRKTKANERKKNEMQKKRKRKESYKEKRTKERGEVMKLCITRLSSALMNWQ